jgi:hypothetical protein
MKILILVINICFVLNGKMFSQDELNAQYEYARQLFSNEKYFDAVTEFKRLIFFDTTSEYAFEANRFIGESYKQGGRFDDAIKYFGIALLNSETEKQKYDLNIQIIRANILRHSTERAHQLLDSLEAQNIPETKNEINYWRGWIFIFQDDWQKAAEQFQFCDTSKFLANFCKDVDGQKYSVQFAKLSSVFIPGAGQFYTGEYLSGLMSLAWNLTAGYFSINSFIEDRIFDGVITSTLLWMRFYRGNLQNAEQFAIGKNLYITNKALRILQNNLHITKP